METLSTDEFASLLGLNIVAEPNAATPPKKKRKNNKYERRRRRAQQTRDRKNNSPDATNQQPPTDALASADEESSRTEDVMDKALHSDSQLGVQVWQGLANEEKIPLEESQSSVLTDKHKDASELLPIPSRQSNNTLPRDAAERAKYLAEFHARPLELDRRAGAVVLQKQLPSKESSHVFAKATEWHDFGLHQRLVNAITSSPFSLKRPTVIQSRAIPAFFQNAGVHNMLLQSETGSGKTLAYLLPLLHSLVAATDDTKIRQDRAQAGTRCIILCPTRELAVQTLDTAERLLTKSFYWLVTGGLLGQEKRKSEKARLRKGIAILICTPGRLLDHLTRTESLLLALKGKLEFLVLDEVDRLLDMGLGAQVQQIIERIRANQPGSGRCGNGITWRSVLVSATVPSSVEKLAKETLVGGDSTWVRVKAEDSQLVANNDDKGLADSTPRQLQQYYVSVTAKLRLAGLVAFLVQRAEGVERTVVFLSTCASVDFHHAIFKAVDCIMGSEDEKGIFGSRCPVFKLHGNVPHAERQQVLRRFAKGGDDKAKSGALLLATDVAARGLNLPHVDWTVQYDPPSEVSDYVHRAGRVARAGNAGRSLLFLLPSESLFLNVLKQRGVQKMNALSLASILNSAAGICKALSEEGVRRSGGGLGQSKSSASRSGEAFCAGIQYRFEECIAMDDKQAKSEHKARLSSQKRKRSGEKPEDAVGTLLKLAQSGFFSHIRAYPSREKLVRHIFSAKSLHLGHVARSFALREHPRQLASRRRKRVEPESEKHNGSMAFDFASNDAPAKGKLSEERKASRIVPSKSAASTSDKKRQLMANAARLQAHSSFF